MPFSFKPAISPTGNGAEGSSFSFGSTDDLSARAKEDGLSLIDMAVYAVFGVACFVALVLFGYRYYLNSQIEAARVQITAKEQELSNFHIDDMRSLSVRIKAISQLTKEHPYVNAAFRVLENSIENQIVYKSFNLRSIQGKYTLVIEAVSPDYKSIVQQVDTLSNPPYNMYIPNIKVEGLVPDQSGRIAFSLEMPISISGTMPEEMNFSYGASARASSTAGGSPGATTTPVTLNASSTNATTTPRSGTSTPPLR